MMITYQVEPWASYWPECVPLWEKHYAEFAPFHRGRLAFGPDLGMYQELETQGRLQILVARSAGKMVGYCLMIFRRHPHYTNVCGFEDSYYILPEFRRGWNGVKLISRSIALARKRGVEINYFMTKEFNSVQMLFERLGLLRCDTVYCTGLGN